MELEAVPEIEGSVRRALLAAFEDAGVRASGPSGYDDAWRRTALREAVEDDDSPVGYAPSPRSTLGATRA